jgi:hypothetical protein
MSRRTLARAAITGLFLALFGLAWREAALARRAESDLGAAVSKHAELVDALRRQKELFAAASRLRTGMEAKLGGLKSALAHPPSKDAALKVLALAAAPWREVVLAKEPKLQALYLAAERASLPARYGPFLRPLGLSAEQTAKFDDVQLAAAERALDIKASAEAQGLTLDDPAVAALLKQSAQELQSAQADLLGADGVQQLQQYERSLPMRAFVDSLGGALAFTDAPLNAQQANQLLQQLLGASSSYQDGGIAISPRLTTVYSSLMASQSLAQEPVDWDSVLPQAQATLSGSQFAMLNAAMQENLTTMQLFNMMMEQTKNSPLVGFVYSRKPD